MKDFHDNVLNSLPIYSGEYLFLTNRHRPSFILPMHNRYVYKMALSLITPMSRKGKVVKAALKITSFFLLRWLFDKEFITTKSRLKKYYALIIPFNMELKTYEKLTLINFSKEEGVISVSKIGFPSLAKQLIKNEASILAKFVDHYDSCVPKFLSFTENSFYAMATVSYLEGEKTDTISLHIESFMNSFVQKTIPLCKHPYILKTKDSVFDALLVSNKKNLQQKFACLFSLYALENISITLMHGDFSKSNIILQKSGKQGIIDWEDADEEGLPVDIAFYRFKKNLSQKYPFIVYNLIDALAVYQYVVFLVKRNNLDALRIFDTSKRRKNVIEWKI